MISADFLGRTGNNMFQYAMARTIAESKGFHFWFNKKKFAHHEIFNLDFGFNDAPIQQVYGESGHTFDPNVFNVGDNIVFNGYWQCEKYFDHDKARQWFKFDSTAKAEEILSTHPIDQYCYINLRGTDMKLISSQKLDVGYYNDGIRIMRLFLPDIKFLVITDDVEYGHEYFPDLEITTNDVHTDFCLLNRAKYLIIANSTFSWWAAWLNLNNVVIAPYGWSNTHINKWVFSPADIKVERWLWI
jgi:hypothetical protein